MKETKFRAFYKLLNLMVMPEKLESINFETKVLGVYIPIGNKVFHKFRLSDFELMQFSGVHDDVADEEIYAGHIVKLEYEGEIFHCRVHQEGPGFMLVSNKLVDGYVWMSELVECDRDHFWIPNCNVVGNMYENFKEYPELIGI